jgi:hypothetical protein
MNSEDAGASFSDYAPRSLNFFVSMSRILNAIQPESQRVNDCELWTTGVSGRTAPVTNDLLDAVAGAPKFRGTIVSVPAKKGFGHSLEALKLRDTLPEHCAVSSAVLEIEVQDIRLDGLLS